MGTYIMVVDDEPDLELMVTMNFSDKIKKNEYHFVFARDGVEAIEKLNGNSEIDVVLTDINMPRMDGLTLLSKLNESYPVLRTVIVSAYGDMSNIRTALNRGAFDFVTKPIDLQDLEVTLEKTIREAVVRRQASVDHQRLQNIEGELGVARRIQTSILPRKFPAFPDHKEFEIYAAMTPAREVGGDFYDFFLVDKDRLGFVIGDVSNKGVPAALFMAVARTFLKATALMGLSPRDCLERINASLYHESVSEMFVTIFYGLLDTRTGEVRYCNGGHNIPFILRENGEVEETEKTSGIVLGAMENSRYKEKECILAAGDTIVLYTDGITEAENASREMFSEEQLVSNLKDLADKSAMEICSKVVSDVNEFSGGAPQSDDVTILALKYLG